MPNFYMSHIVINKMYVHSMENRHKNSKFENSEKNMKRSLFFFPTQSFWF